MKFKTYGKKGDPTLMLIPGLGVSYEIFMPLIGMLEDRFHIIAVEVDGFTLGCNTEFTSTYSLMSAERYVHTEGQKQSWMVTSRYIPTD